ncbi:MAG: GDSL-type esterase/lipase family protein [Lachnospiraceae bacterium]|nr:GDSL-type esterase/lipase family protein [Lachnospiraceae bacterium]
MKKPIRYFVVINLFLWMFLYGVCPVSASELQSEEETQEVTAVSESDDYSLKNPPVLLDGKEISYQFVDSTYPTNVQVITTKRNRTLKTVSEGTYMTLKNGSWVIESQVWTEPANTTHQITYTNTSGISLPIPNRDYKVSVTFQNSGKSSYQAAVWDERGIQTKNKTVNPGKTVTVTATVSVIDGNLKLFFIPKTNAYVPENGWANVQVSGISIETITAKTQSAIPTIHIAGDSTAHTRTADVYPREGWGQEFYQCFNNGKLLSVKERWDTQELTSYAEYKTSTLVIKNWAYSGESSSSYWRKGRFDNILNDANPGDYVLVQLGHNDSASSKIEVYSTESEYRENLVTFAKACQTRGIQCIFMSCTPRCVFSGAKLAPTLPTYKSAMRSAASKAGVPFVDINKAIVNYMNTLGKSATQSYYMILKAGQYSNYPFGYHDRSHLNQTGAKKIAQITAVTLKESGVFPAKISSHITAADDYYSDVTLTISQVKVTKTTVKKTTKKAAKKKKNQVRYKVSWKKQNKAKQYVVYQYVESRGTYKKIASTKNNYYTLKKGTTKKQASKIKIKAILNRYY